MTSQLWVVCVCVCVCDAVSPTQTFFWISDTFIADNFFGWNLCLNKLNGKELLIVHGLKRTKVISRGSELTTQPNYQSQNTNHKKFTLLQSWIKIHFLIPCPLICLNVCVVWKLCPSKLDRRKMKAHGIFLPLKNGSQHPLCFFPERSERRRRPKSWSSRLLPSRPTMSSHVQHADWIWDRDLDSRLKI